MWLSLVERCVRDAEAAGSNPVASTILWVQNRYPPRKPTNHHGLVGFFVSKNNLGKKDTSTTKTVIGGI